MLLSVLLTFFFSFNNTKEDNWRQIIPLRTSRAEVQRLIGKHYWEYDNTVFYIKNGDRYYVTYSQGNCRGKEETKWNVGKNIVLDFVIYPKNKVAIDDMPYNLKTFIKIKGSEDMPNYYKYLNKEFGLILETQVLGRSGIEYVTGIVVSPKNSDISLKCS